MQDLTNEATFNPVGGAARPASIIAGLLQEAGRALDHDVAAARRLIEQANAMLLPQTTKRAVTTGRLAPWQERRVRDHVIANLDATLRVEDLAAVARLSASYFKRAFKATFGETPHAFVQRMRVERAQRLMLEGRDPLAQIALACGLADQAHLSRLFRRSTGSSPSVWRRRHGDSI